MNVRPPGVISDHSLITWTLPFTHQPPIAKRKSVQSWKRVDRELRQSIIESDLCTANTSDISAEMMFRTYDRVLREISNKLAPPRETIVRVQPIAVWYDDESRLLRRRSRALERKYRRTGLTSDRILWVQQEKKAQSQPCEGECILAGTDLGTLRSTSQVMEGLLIHHGSGSCDVDVNWKSVGSGFAGVLCSENRNNTKGDWWHSSHY